MTKFSTESCNGNAADYFVDRHLDTAYADKPAFREVDGHKRRLSYREIATESAKLVDLYARHGIQREDRVALLLLDQIEFPISHPLPERFFLPGLQRTLHRAAA